MKLKEVILLLFAITPTLACDSTDNKFILNNRTSVTKSFYFSKDSTAKTAIKFYSELFYATPKNGNIPKGFDLLKPNSRRAIGMLGPWEDYLDEQFENGIAYIYVIDSSSIGRKPEIMLRDNLLSRYKVTSKFMRENNWELFMK